MPRIPLASAEKLLKTKDEDRISASAKEELRSILEEKARTVGKNATAMAKHAQRKTILESDVAFVLEHDRL